MLSPFSPPRQQRKGGSSGASTTATPSSQAPASQAAGAQLLATPPPAARRGAPAAAPAALPAPVQLRGLSGHMPVLWAQMGFEPEGSAALTPAQAKALAVITSSYALPVGRTVGVLSGMTGEERIFSAYYSGRLQLLPGVPRPPICCNRCGGEHAPQECSAKL